MSQQRIFLPLDEIKAALDSKPGSFRKPIRVRTATTTGVCGECHRDIRGVITKDIPRDAEPMDGVLGLIHKGKHQHRFLDDHGVWTAACPWGRVGDLLWVAEDFYTVQDVDGITGAVRYRDHKIKMVPTVDKGMDRLLFGPSSNWVSAVQMKRSFSRLTLKTTKIGFEREDGDGSRWMWVIDYDLGSIFYGNLNHPEN